MEWITDQSCSIVLPKHQAEPKEKVGEGGGSQCNAHAVHSFASHVIRSQHTGLVCAYALHAFCLVRGSGLALSSPPSCQRPGPFRCLHLSVIKSGMQLSCPLSDKKRSTCAGWHVCLVADQGAQAACAHKGVHVYVRMCACQFAPSCVSV